MQTDELARTDAVGGKAEQRIIGIELRYVDPVTGLVEEVALIPCDVRLPIASRQAAWTVPNGRINATIHTTFGDANFPQDAILRA